MKVTIKGKEIELKSTLRSQMMYENIKGESFKPSSLENIVTFMYCCVVGSSKDYSLGYDEFLDEVDEQVQTLNEFVAWLVAQAENQNKLKKE